MANHVLESVSSTGAYHVPSNYGLDQRFGVDWAIMSYLYLSKLALLYHKANSILHGVTATQEAKLA